MYSQSSQYKMENSVFFCQPLGMIPLPVHSRMPPGPGLYSKQTSPEHNLNVEHLAFSDCLCAAVDCCHPCLKTTRCLGTTLPDEVMKLCCFLMKRGAKRCRLWENSEGLHNICLARRGRRFRERKGTHHSYMPGSLTDQKSLQQAQIIAHAAVSHSAPNYCANESGAILIHKQISKIGGTV